MCGTRRRGVTSRGWSGSALLDASFAPSRLVLDSMSRENAMPDQTTEFSREEIILAALSPAGGVPHTPVQVQKLLFLVDRNLAPLIGGPKFNFEPYHYGPFDQEVYSTLGELARRGLVEITRSGNGNWREYRLTPEGQFRGVDLLAALDERVRDYIERASDFVRRLSFTELVSAIYKAYPEMRERSVFQE